MKTLKLFFLPLLESLEFAWQVIRYVLIFASAFFRQRASMGCEMVAIRSQLSFYKNSICQKKQPRPRFHPAFRLLCLSRVWSGWKFAADLMKPETVLKWHEHAFLHWWRWKSRQRQKGLRLLEAGSPATKRHAVTQDTKRPLQNWTPLGFRVDTLRFFEWTGSHRPQVQAWR